MVVRTRFLAAALLALPLAACQVDNADLPEGAQKFDDVAQARSAVQVALAALPSAKVAGAHDSGIPYMITGNLGTATVSTQGLTARPSLSKALPGIAAAFNLQSTDLAEKSSFKDADGNTHTRYGQLMNGLTVENEELIVHTDRNNTIYAANGSAHHDGSIVPARATISEEAARFAAANSTTASNVSVDGLQMMYIRPTSQNDRMELVYRALVQGDGRDGMPVKEFTYVSAATGKVVATNSLIRTALNRKVYTASNGTSTPGTLKRSEGQAATGDSTLDTNYDKLGLTYSCYKDLFGRDSYDNAGATYISTVHYDKNYVNAYWNGTQMVYGDGDGVNSTTLAIDADVTDHELTHAVTERTSGLTYSGESGGLNEAMSDIASAFCSSYRTSWSTTDAIFEIGETIWTPGTAGDALRYMFDPAKDGGSADYYTSSVGSLDVHYSSGIANLWFTLLSRGGAHPRGKGSAGTVTGIGTQKAAQIIYKANTSLFTASTNYAQAKTYTETAASQLGYTSTDIASVTKAWNAVGVGVAAPLPTALTNGVAKTGLGASSGGQLSYYLAVPASKSSTYTISGGTGDADLYVKSGSAPTTSSYDCRPYVTGNSESCTVAATSAAKNVYVMLNAYSTFSGVSLTGKYP